MATLIFDIETIGEDFDALDETTQEALTRWVRKEHADDEAGYATALEDLKQGLGFSPLTGEVVAIGMLEGEQDRGAVYYQAPGQKHEEVERDGIMFKQMSEKEMLTHFWEVVSHCDEFVTFNGRGFDVPFLMIRSAIHGIRPSKDLLSNRYLGSQRYDAKHVDLQDQLSFYGAAWRQGSRSLHMYCRAFGIESPKAGGVTGDDVATLFREKRFFDIAAYNVGDIRATKALYEKWRDFLRV
ncbi:MAG TPA: ribonuclease H-like domain-containing protein [Candidatus Paceibacterota bacterium]